MFTVLLSPPLEQAERHHGPAAPSLTSWLQEQQRRNPGKLLRVVVVDLEKYFR